MTGGPIHLEIEDVVRALDSVPLFSRCDETELRDVARRGHVLGFADGAVIVPEGEEGLGFYVILSGRARVERGGEVVERLGANDFFGEISLLEGAPRIATVLSDGGVVVLGILRSHFRPLLARNPRLALRVLDEQARRRDSSA
ncbi:MAG: cyclic nucleotide-binding domain-containing protein [Acidobacteria bacterium]|nr:cyclic nucleotide-binding domain-containing protein [Acidobacteriota bacterium]